MFGFLFVHYCNSIRITNEMASALRYELAWANKRAENSLMEVKTKKNLLQKRSEPSRPEPSRAEPTGLDGQATNAKKTQDLIKK